MLTNNTYKKNIAKCLITISVIYFVLLLVWIASQGTGDYAMLDKLFMTVNPFTWGAYFLGITAVVALYCFKSKLLICAVWFCYAFNLSISFIVFMGVYNTKDMLMYLPHIIFIICGATLLGRKRKQ